MGTVGEQLLLRVQAMETAIADLQSTHSSTRDLSDLRSELNAEMSRMRELVMGQGGRPADGGMGRSPYNSKEFLPDVLGSAYKDKWRTWSYKARDWIRNVTCLGFCQQCWQAT